MNKPKKFIVKKMVVKYIDTDNNIDILRDKLDAIFINFDTNNRREVFDCPIYTVYFEETDEYGHGRPNYVNNKDVDYVIYKDMDLALMDAEDAAKNYQYTLERYRDKDSILYLPKVNIVFTYPSTKEYKEQLGLNLWRNLEGYIQTPKREFITNQFGDEIYLFDTSFVRVFINNTMQRPIHNSVLKYTLNSKGLMDVRKGTGLNSYYEDMKEFTSIRSYLNNEMRRLNSLKEEVKDSAGFLVSIRFTANNTAEDKAKCDNIMNEINLLMKESGLEYNIYTGVETKFPD